MAAYCILYLFQKKGNLLASSFELKAIYGALVAWFVLVLLDGFRATDMTEWLNEVMLKAPLLIVPLYMLSLTKKDSQYENVWLFFVSVTSSVAILSGINYALHFDEINTLLLQSKHIPLVGNIHHIYFGVYQALCIWVSVYFISKGSKKAIWRINLIVLIVMIHILASRTGLLAFYASVGVFVIVIVRESGRFKPLIIGMAFLLVVPVLGYQLSSSFKNKVLNSIEDFDAVQSGKDINYKSLAMRVEAWKTGTAVFKEHPWIGVGTMKVRHQMQAKYIENKTILYKENRIGPHNQFLEMTMAHGLLASILLIVVFGLAYSSRIDTPVFLGLLTVFFITFLLEAYLERQQGIIAFCVVFFGFYHVTSSNSQET